MRIHTQRTGAPNLLFVSLIVIFAASIGSLRAQCNEAISNFTLIGDFENSTYYRSNAPAQPMQAESIALNLGGHLVSINSAAENAFVQAGIDEMTYIGLDDRQQEGSLGWTDGSTLSYTNYDLCGFCQDNDGENDYTVMHPWNGGWSFMNRWSSRNYIIEIPCDDNSGGGNNGGGNAGGGSEDCAESYPGFEFLGEHSAAKYFLSTGTSRPADAQAAAAALNGNLATINNQAENDFLQAQIDEMVYIGLSDASAEGNLRWLSGENAGYRNVDENCGFCADNDAENDYTVMHPWNGEWSFSSQWSQRRFIMEVPCEDDGGGNNNSTLAFSNCPADRVIQTAPGQSTAFVSWTPPSLTSSCQTGGISVGLISGPNNNSNLGEGTYTIQYRGANNCGDVEMCEFTITILDAEETSSLDISCASNLSLSIPTGNTTTTLSFDLPSVSNQCNMGNATLLQTSGPSRNDQVGPGNYTIHYRATNPCGDIDECTFSVQVGSTDSSLTLDCGEPLDFYLPIGIPTTGIFFSQPEVINECNIPGTTVRLLGPLGQGSTLAVGEYQTFYEATNNCGDIATCAVDITMSNTTLIMDNDDVGINCPDAVTITTAPGSDIARLEWPEITPVGCGTEDGQHTIRQVSGRPYGSFVGIGTYDITVRTAKFNNNSCPNSYQCTFQVHVVSGGETQGLSIDCPDDINVLIPPGESRVPVFYDEPIVVSDCNQGGVELTRLAGPSSGFMLFSGSYRVIYQATNNCGDVSVCEFNINVENEPLEFTVSCPDNIVVSTSDPLGTIVNYNAPTINIENSTLCGYIPELEEGIASGLRFPVGTTTINYEFTRAPAISNCGHVSDCTFTVTVMLDGNISNSGGNVNYTANDQVTPYTGVFRPGTNVGYNPPWSDEEMANLAAGNDALGIKGIGAKTMRPGLFDVITAVYGYDFRLETYEHYASLGLEDLTMIVGFPADWHRDQTDYCGNGFNSSMFRNLYTDIWDNGENGTPYNDENFYAAYLYEVVSMYGEHVKFWEIWNEPGFDLTGNRGWRQPGDPVGNWWDNDPDPCEYILRAPIEHYVRTLRISWEIIKTLQPDDYVAVAGVGFVSFLDAILRNTDDPFNGGEVNADFPNRGGAYFDVMGFHSYPDIDGSVYEINQNGERIFNRHSDEAAQGITKTKTNYQAILDNYGYDGVQSPEKEWIITELNVPRKPFRPMAMSGGEEMQVNYIIKAVVAAMKNDIHQIHVYNLGDEETEAEAVTEFHLYGLHKRLMGTEPYTQVRNLEAIAYKSAADFVFNSRYDEARTNQMNLPSNLDGIALRLNNGRYKYIIWAKTTQDQSEAASGTYSFPANFGYGQVFMRTWNFTDTDQVVGISSNNISLTGRPIFITETANPSDIQARRGEQKNLQLAVNEILPNPAVDEIRLVLEAKESDNYDIQIYDATGSLLVQRKTFIQRGTSDERFDISSYSHGMYFIIIQDSNMRSTKVKFIKVEDLD